MQHRCAVYTFGQLLADPAYWTPGDTFWGSWLNPPSLLPRSHLANVNINRRPGSVNRTRKRNLSCVRPNSCFSCKTLISRGLSKMCKERDQSVNNMSCPMQFDSPPGPWPNGDQEPVMTISTRALLYCMLSRRVDLLKFTFVAFLVPVYRRSNIHGSCLPPVGRSIGQFQICIWIELIWSSSDTVLYRIFPILSGCWLNAPHGNPHHCLSAEIVTTSVFQSSGKLDRVIVLRIKHDTSKADKL